MTLENELAKITARSVAPDKDHAEARGTKAPALTAQDVAMAAAIISRPAGYHLIMAKFTQDPGSEAWLATYLAEYGWMLWHKRRREARITVETHDTIARIALLSTMNPEAHRRLGVSGAAKRAGCHEQTWRARYRSHHDDLAGHLNWLESWARSEMARYLYGPADDDE